MLSGAGSPACATPKVVRKSIVTTVFLMALPFDQGLRHDFLPTGGAVLYTMTAASCDQFTLACHWEEHGQCGRSGGLKGPVRIAWTGPRHRPDCFTIDRYIRRSCLRALYLVTGFLTMIVLVMRTACSSPPLRIQSGDVPAASLRVAQVIAA